MNDKKDDWRSREDRANGAETMGFDANMPKTDPKEKRGPDQAVQTSPPALPCDGGAPFHKFSGCRIDLSGADYAAFRDDRDRLIATFKGGDRIFSDWRGNIDAKDLYILTRHAMTELLEEAFTLGLNAAAGKCKTSVPKAVRLTDSPRRAAQWCADDIRALMPPDDLEEQVWPESKGVRLHAERGRK